jgi:hypothetical protein
MFVVVRYDSNRDIVKVGEGKTIEDAQEIMTNDFKEMFYEKYGNEMGELGTSFEVRYEIEEDNDQCALDSTSAWLNNSESSHRLNYDWAIIAVGE